MNENDVLSIEKYRSELYRAFSKCYSPPEPGISEVLKQLETGLCATGSIAISQVIMMRSELNTSISVDDLEIQFAKLFIGPYQLLAPPFGSIYLDDKRQIMGDSTLDVVKRYLAAGLTVDEGFKNPPDHISAELEFMHVLIVEELNCLHKGRADEAAASLVQQSEFIDSHLGQWIDAFTGLTIQETELPYYRYLATATQQFIREDMQRLGETVADWHAQSETAVE